MAVVAQRDNNSSLRYHQVDVAQTARGPDSLPLKRVPVRMIWLYEYGGLQLLACYNDLTYLTSVKRDISAVVNGFIWLPDQVRG